MRRLFLLLACGAFVYPLAACEDDECQTDLDCPPGRICRLGLCALDPGGGDTFINLPDGVEVVQNCDPAAAGDLVLNEFLADPPGGGSDDEFLEIVNVSGDDVDIKNVIVQIGSDQESLSDFWPVCLPNFAVVAYGRDGLKTLRNAGDTISLLIDGSTVQSVTYPPPPGDEDSSLTLTTQLDPDSGWVKHTDQVGTPSSPGKCSNGNDFPDCAGLPPVEGDQDVVDGDDGEVTPLCSTTPTVGDLVINEILADPTGLDANGDGTVDTSDDEFIEIVNVSAETLLLTGVKITEAGGKEFTFPAGTCLASNQAVVLFQKYESGGSFGGALPFDLGDFGALNNSDDTITLLDASGAELNKVTYGSEANDDQSITREIDVDSNATFVKHSLAPLSMGAKMSPGTCQNGNAFPDCSGGQAEVVEQMMDTVDDTSTPMDATVDTTVQTDEIGPTCGPAAGASDLVINEVMANAGTATDWDQDGAKDAEDDEYVEIINVSGGAVDLENVTISDAVGVKFTFAAGACLDAGNAAVVFGKGDTPALAPSGALVIVPASGGLGLNNSGDTVTLTTAGAAQIDQLVYSDNNVTAGVSLSRSPDKTGDFVLHPDLGGGVQGSPGTCVNGNTFPTCQ